MALHRSWVPLRGYRNWSWIRVWWLDRLWYRVARRCVFLNTFQTMGYVQGRHIKLKLMCINTMNYAIEYPRLWDTCIRLPLLANSGASRERNSLIESSISEPFLRSKTKLESRTEAILSSRLVGRHTESTVTVLLREDCNTANRLSIRIHQDICLQ